MKAEQKGQGWSEGDFVQAQVRNAPLCLSADAACRAG